MRRCPGLAEIAFRQSGAPADAPIPGLFTRDGWAWARDVGAQAAVERTRAVSPPLLGDGLPRREDAAERVMDRLQAETLARWRDYLADLRVRPFADRETSLLVSGALARRGSPLTGLMEEVWVQVGGADDRRRHDQQLRIAAAFGSMKRYGDGGGMEEIAGLFGALNVALRAADDGAVRHRLMSVQDRARSIAAMRQAPEVVVRIVEDVLAQTSGAQPRSEGDPLLARWRSEVVPACRAAVSGRYPFAEGPDADPGAVEALLAPGGVLDRFVQEEALPHLDTDERPWRWLPEARFEGLDPDGAAFLERAHAVSAALFGPDGRLGAELTLTALAERGSVEIVLGGRAAPIRTQAAPATLAWPGPDPQGGVEVRFRAGAEAASLSEPGPWGLLRLLDRVRLRARDEGRRFLVDLRTEAGRVFVEVSFAQAANPVAARPLLGGFDCPEAL